LIKPSAARPAAFSYRLEHRVEKWTPDFRENDAKK